jgi:arylsulfatase A-like enzyme
MTGQGGKRNRRTFFTPVFGSFLLLVLLFAGGCRQPSLDGTVQHLDLGSQLPRAEAWGPVELLDLGTGQHKLNLVDGLYFAEREPDGRTYAWSWGENSIFQLTCPAVRPRTLAIRCRRLGVEALEDLLVSVSLNGTLLGTFTPGTEYADHRLETPAEVWQEGDNLLVLLYSKDVYLPDVFPGSTDTRRVAVQLDAIRIIADTEAGDEAQPVTAVGEGVDLPLPADVSWYVEIPQEGLLIFGGEADHTALLRVTVAVDDGPTTEIFRRRFRAGTPGKPVVLDLERWADRSVRLTFSVDPADGAGGDNGPTFHLLRPEIRVPAAAPPALPPGTAAATGAPPNVLIYVMDALRAGNLSTYGHQRRTSPVLDRLSRQGLLFRSAFAQAPNTTPSVKSLFTGRYLPFTGHTVLSADHPTLAEVFTRSGYATGLFTNNPNLGPEVGYHRGFGHVAREIFFRRQPVKDFARQATDAFVRWAGSLPPGQPYFAYVHTIHPHNPYEAPFPFDHMFLPAEQRNRAEDLSTEALLGFAHGERQMGDSTLQRMKDFYDGDILYNDLELGRLLAWLRGPGPDRETVIAFTADHGEELADHGGLLHGYTLYDEQIHVPLILLPPAGSPGRVIADNVRLVDLAPTIFELSGIGNTPPLEGETLTGFMAGAPAAPDPDRPVYSSASSATGLYTLRTGKWKYIFAPRTRHLWGMGQGLGRTRELHYLFDLEADPGEQVNLASRDQITRKALQARLLEWIDSQARLDEESEDQERIPELDEETRERLRDLGYIVE